MLTQNGSIDDALIFDVFISYSSIDLKYALQIHKSLTYSGKKSWLDKSNIIGGDQYSEKIVEAIEHSRIFLLLISENSLQSTEVFREVTLAGNKKKRLIIIDLDNVKNIPKRFEHQLAGLSRTTIPRKQLADRTNEITALVTSELNKITEINYKTLKPKFQWNSHISIFIIKMAPPIFALLVIFGLILSKEQKNKNSNQTSPEDIALPKIIKAVKINSADDFTKYKWDIHSRIEIRTPSPSMGSRFKNAKFIIFYRKSSIDHWESKVMPIDAKSTHLFQEFSLLTNISPIETAACLQIPNLELGGYWHVLTTFNSKSQDNSTSENNEIEYIQKNITAIHTDKKSCETLEISNL